MKYIVGTWKVLRSEKDKIWGKNPTLFHFQVGGILNWEMERSSTGGYRAMAQDIPFEPDDGGFITKFGRERHYRVEEIDENLCRIMGENGELWQVARVDERLDYMLGFVGDDGSLKK